MIKNFSSLADLVNIVEVIDRFVPLRRCGVNFSAKCPFHEERTASFMVDPVMNRYKCFGCGAAGDVFNFIQNFKHVDFLDSVRFVADLYNFILEDDQVTKEVSSARLILERALSLFVQALNRNDQVKSYLYKRGLNDSLIKDYQIGFCSPEVVNELKKSYNQQELEASGLGKNISFYKRITFPLRDFDGQLCGFNGRFYGYSKMSNNMKYLNPRNTELFIKHKILANFSKAKPSIRAKKQIIITEGFFDVIALAAFGYDNAVCCIGCGFSLDHLNKLKALSRTLGKLDIVFCFDRDAAGRQATIKALEFCLKQAYLSVSVVYFKHESFKDLGDFLKAKVKPQLFRVDGFKYLCRYAFHPAQAVERKDSNYQAIMHLIKDLPPFIQASYRRVVSSFLPQLKDAKADTKPEVDFTQFDINKLSDHFLEGRILATMLVDSDFKYIVSRYLSGSDFPVLHSFYEALFEGKMSFLEPIRRFEPFKREVWGVVLEAFKRTGLTHSLLKALESKDLRLADLLQAKLAKLANPIVEVVPDIF